MSPTFYITPHFFDPYESSSGNVLKTEGQERITETQTECYREAEIDRRDADRGETV